MCECKPVYFEKQCNISCATQSQSNCKFCDISNTYRMNSTIQLNQFSCSNGFYDGTTICKSKNHVNIFLFFQHLRIFISLWIVQDLKIIELFAQEIFSANMHTLDQIQLYSSKCSSQLENFFNCNSVHPIGSNPPNCICDDHYYYDYDHLEYQECNKYCGKCDFYGRICCAANRIQNLKTCICPTDSIFYDFTLIAQSVMQQQLMGYFLKIQIN